MNKTDSKSLTYYRHTQERTRVSADCSQEISVLCELSGHMV